MCEIDMSAPPRIAAIKERGWLNALNVKYVAEVYINHKIHVIDMFAMNILGFWLSPCSPLISELAKSVILVVYFLTKGILDVIRASIPMIKSSFLMPMIMTESTIAMKTATAVKIFTARLDSSAWVETSNMVTTPMLSSPIMSNVRSTTIEDRLDANPVPSFSPRV